MGSPTCEYCGRCLSVCPSYKHYWIETMGPRARIDMAHAVENNQLVPGLRYAQSIKSCLQCLACTEICGKGVDGAQIILDARLSLASTKLGAINPMEKFFISALLANRPLLKNVIVCLRTLQKIFSLDTQGEIRHLPDVFSGFIGKRSLPNISSKTLQQLLPEHCLPQDGQVIGEVCLFTGCFGSLVNVNASLHLVAALNSLGYTVHIPKDQACCGAPAQLSGQRRPFEKIQERNADVFARYAQMPILTQCATCHRTLSREYVHAGRELSKRIMDSAQFLFEKGFGMLHQSASAASRPSEARHNAGAKELLVAIHDPCHLRLDPSAGKSLRSLLSAKPGVRLVELKETGVCCGGGGITSLKNPALADELGNARAMDVIESGADIVVTQCPGCVLQLNNHLMRLGARQRARHALELIAT